VKKAPACWETVLLLVFSEHSNSKFHGARWVTALLVLLAVGGTLDYENGERYVNFALEALYSKDSVKFDEIEMPGHHGSTGAMVNVYEIELNKYKIDNPEVCQSGSGPMEENEPNDVWTGVSALVAASAIKWTARLRTCRQSRV